MPAADDVLPAPAARRRIRPAPQPAPAAADSDAIPAPASRRRHVPAPPVAVVEDVVPATADSDAKMQQMLHLQDFLHNSQQLDMKQVSLETSSTPQEIESRMDDLRYRLGMLGALSKVLVEELDMLEAALAQRLARHPD